MAKFAMEPDHLTDDEKIQQMDKCIKLLEDREDRFNGWEREFWEGIVLRIGANLNYVPSWRELNALKNMVERYG